MWNKVILKDLGKRRGGELSIMVVFVEFAVFAIHFIVNDRVPFHLAQTRRNVVLACPATKFKFFDEIDFALIDRFTVRVHHSAVK